MGTIMGVVPAVAPVLGGLLQAGFGWRASFIVTIAGTVALALVVYVGLPETNVRRGGGSLSPLGIMRSYGTLLQNRSYRVYAGLTALAYSGLFAFISGSSFVFQGIYGLGEIAYGFAFSFGVLGFITGTLVARRLIGSRGLDRTIGVGVAFLAGGGLVMLACVLAGLGGVLGIAAPMALYACGVGLTMPQALACAMQPFPRMAGAASSFVGLVQMTFAAAVGVGLGHGIGSSPVPLPATVAALGIAAFVLFHASAGIRARAA
jgi:DHA1 family bicyclomycin/chloramphenicol resistance-like MFS transporter